jgi:hypothetical protein
MIQPRQWLPLAIPLALAAAALIAQPETPESTGVQPEQAEPAPGTDQTTAGAGQDSSPARNESPFEYRPSEEISEDLPVSFPVDI